MTTLSHSFKENDPTKTHIHNRSFKKVCLKRLRSVRLSWGVICRLWVLCWNEHRLLQEMCVQPSPSYPSRPHNVQDVLIFYDWPRNWSSILAARKYRSVNIVSERITCFRLVWKPSLDNNRKYHRLDNWRLWCKKNIGSWEASKSGIICPNLYQDVVYKCYTRLDSLY